MKYINTTPPILAELLLGQQVDLQFITLQDQLLLLRIVRVIYIYEHNSKIERKLKQDLEHSLVLDR